MTKTLSICAMLLAGCYPQGDVRHCSGDNVRWAVSQYSCSIDRTCMLTGKEYASMDRYRQVFPQCFSREVER